MANENKYMTFVNCSTRLRRSRRYLQFIMRRIRISIYEISKLNTILCFFLHLLKFKATVEKLIHIRLCFYLNNRTLSSERGSKEGRQPHNRPQLYSPGVIREQARTYRRGLVHVHVLQDLSATATVINTHSQS